MKHPVESWLKSVSMTWMLLAGLLVFLLWSLLFEIDQTVRAQGQIIPGGRTQVIQAADGGILSEILVHEGQTVKAGQRIAVLERDRSDAAVRESEAKDASLLAALTRAQAEAQGTTPVWPKKLQSYPDFIRAQQALHEQKKRTLEEELKSLQDALEMARQELEMNDALLKTGDVSLLEVMRAKRQLSELQGRANAVRNKYLQDARQEISKLSEDIASSHYKLMERKNILDHTVLTAPVAGVVKLLKVNTIGGVLRSGDELMQISPTESEMVLEIKVNPADIGQLKLDLPAAVRFDAFDSGIYGALQGTLGYISSDTISEQGSNGQSSTYYRARVLLTKPSAQSKMSQIDLKPGMNATVDIRTNSRSVLQYLAKPIFKAFSGAMSER